MVIWFLAGLTPANWPISVSAQTYQFDLVHKFATDPEIDDGASFGAGVALQGNTALISATDFDFPEPGAGIAFLYDLDTGEVLREFVPPQIVRDGNFGADVALYDRWAIIGDPGPRLPGQETVRKIYIFDTETGDLAHTLTSPPAFSDELFGDSFVVSDGLLIANSIARTPFMFDIASGEFLRTVVGEGVPLLSRGIIDFDGDLALSPATFESDRAYVVDIPSSQVIHELAGSDDPPPTIDRGAILGDYAVFSDRTQPNGSSLAAGAAYVFDLRTGEQIHKLTPPGQGPSDLFGHRIAMHGELVVISSGLDFGAGVHVFNYLTGEYLTELDPGDISVQDEYGEDLAINDEYILIGAQSQRTTTGADLGAAYVYRYALVPEPGTAGLLILAVAGATVRRRR